MTILTGIICSDSIVLAADSRMTEYASGVMGHTDKISVVRFSGSDDVLIAQAGSSSVTNKVITVLRENLTYARRIKNPQVVTDELEEAIKWSYGQNG